MDFKIRVIKNIGALSEELFGVPNTEFEVVNGAFEDLEGFEWDNDLIPFANVEEVNNFFNDDDPWQTVFELANESITLIGCMENYLMKDKITIIENGQVVGFKNEEN